MDAASRCFALRPEPFREAGALKRTQKAGRLEAMREVFLGWFGQVAALASIAAEVENVRRAWQLAGAECEVMHVNRLMRGAARAHELLIHDHLERAYRSLAARAEARARAG